jgi:hypothetical protein
MNRPKKSTTKIAAADQRNSAPFPSSRFRARNP